VPSFHNRNTLTKCLKINQRENQKCKSKKDRQYNGQNKRNKRTNNDVRNTTQKTKDRETRTSLKPWVNNRETRTSLKPWVNNRETRTSLKPWVNTWLIRAKLCRNNIWNVLCCKKSV
jgi:hypothetical protein